MLISIILEELAIDVTIANDGVEAVDIAKKENFDLCLMDINMPNKNGEEAMIDIKEYQKTKEYKTPLIALTANTISGDKQRFLKAGFNDYLAKPIDTKQLISLLKRYL